MTYRPLTHPQKEATRGGGNEVVDGSAGGSDALSPNREFTLITAAGGTDNGFTLADGREGQRKIVKLTTKGGAGNGVLTPANLHDGTTLTFDAANEFAELAFLGGSWHVLTTTATVA